MARKRSKSSKKGSIFKYAIPVAVGVGVLYLLTRSSTPSNQLGGGNTNPVIPKGGTMPKGGGKKTPVTPATVWAARATALFDFPSASATKLADVPAGTPFDLTGRSGANGADGSGPWTEVATNPVGYIKSADLTSTAPVGG